jgi:MFS family permease
MPSEMRILAEPAVLNLRRRSAQAPGSGILIGAIGLGGLSDYFGRKSMFIVEMIIFMIFLVLLVASQNYFWLVVFPLVGRPPPRAAYRIGGSQSWGCW